MAFADDFTAKHFDKWVNTAVSDAPTRDRVRALMVAEYVEDPEFYDMVGWMALYNYVSDRV